mmetsp:Transcript_14956/g.40795  ORF Transcript_14956/g.40795 Transcript_14956/m.40795 type:complete len:504 (+) Transcript_14956:95-1606(+)
MPLPGPRKVKPEVSRSRSLGCGLAGLLLLAAAAVGLFVLYADPVLLTQAASRFQLPHVQPPERPEWLTPPRLPTETLSEWTEATRQKLPKSWQEGTWEALRNDPIGLTAALCCAALLFGSLLLVLARCCRWTSLEDKIRELEVQEAQAFRELRSVRTQLSELRTQAATRAADAEARAEARARAREARAAARARAAKKWCWCFVKKAPAFEPQQPTTRAVKEEETIDVMAWGPGNKVRPPREEAKAIHDLLAQGKLLIFKLRGRNGTRPRDVYEYTVLDPAQLQPSNLSSDGSRASSLRHSPSSARASGLKQSLQQHYESWRSGFSLATSVEEWDEALDDLQDTQRARFLDALTLLDIDFADGAVVALLRVHNLPGEFTQPLKFGDLLISWSPQRDGGELSVAERATCNMQSVMMLMRWCSRHGATAQHTLLKDAANTAQHEHADLDFDALFRKLFQVSRVVRPGKKTCGGAVTENPSVGIPRVANSGRPPTAAQVTKKYNALL